LANEFRSSEPYWLVGVGGEIHVIFPGVKAVVMSKAQQHRHAQRSLRLARGTSNDARFFGAFRF
jgi:hypothetical protein